MTTRTLLGLALVSVTSVSPVLAQYPTSPPPATPLRPLTFPAFQISTLGNGLEILVVENHELPVVSISLTTPAGSKYEPQGREGLANFVSELITKGTKTRSAEQIAETIEGVGSSLTAFPNQDFLTINSTVLTDHVSLAFELIGDALVNATFPEQEMELARTRFLSSLQAEKSSPDALADRFFVQALYGEHPYGRRPTENSYRAITREGVQAFVGERVRPGGSLLVVAGDITPARVRQLAQQHLGAWSGRAAAAAFAQPPAPRPTHILLVHRPGSEQSNMLVGNLGMRPGDQRYYGAVIANRVLGGGSDARLFKILREDKGWTYGAYSSVTRSQEIGHFQANAEVRNAVTDSALAELMTQLRRIRQEVPPDSELVAAKGFLIGSFPRQIETPSQVASQVSTTRLLKLGDDYLQRYRERLNAVTPQNAAQVARQLIKPDSAVIVVVGDGQAIYDGLAKIAPVHIVDVDGKALAAADLNPEAGAIAFDLSQIVARRDSFQILAQGNPLGTRVMAVRRDGDAWVVEDLLSVPMGGIEQTATIRLNGSTLAPLSNQQQGTMQGQAATVNVTYEGNRVRGTAASPQPSGTPKEITIDTTLAEGTVDSDALTALIPAMALAPGASFTVNAFDASDGVVRPATIKVGEVQDVTVAAGTFASYKVDMQLGPASLVLYISRDTPRRLVKVEIVGQPVSFELVK